MQKRPRELIGDPIDWTDEQLEQLALVTPADLQKATVLWHIDAPPRYKSLLNAEPERTDDATTEQ